MPEQETPKKEEETVSEQDYVQEDAGEVQDDEQLEESSEEMSPELAAVVAGHKIDPKKAHHENIYDILMKQDEITWQSIIKELIKTEQMDPWDIDVSRLSAMFIKTLKKLKEMNLQLSGKVLLAAALLLRIKSSRLVGSDLMEFDRLLASGETDDLYSDEAGFVEGQLNTFGMTLGPEHMRLVPKTPQPRKRKVSVYDLIDALAIALKVKRRRVLSQIQTSTLSMPEKKLDISALMDDLYNCVVNYLSEEQKDRVSFSYLVPGDSKQDKIHTFIPLLHLTNARKVGLDQHEHFGEIWVRLREKGVQKEDDSEYEGPEEPKGKAKPRRKAKPKTKGAQKKAAPVEQEKDLSETVPESPVAAGENVVESDPAA